MKNRKYVDLFPYLILGAALTLGGCVAVVGTEDAVVASLSATGHAATDGISEHKASPDTVSSAQETRRQLANERTRRANHSILDGLFASSPKTKTK